MGEAPVTGNPCAALVAGGQPGTWRQYQAGDCGFEKYHLCERRQRLEISIKKPLGKVSAPEGLQTIIEEEGFTPLPIDLFHGEQAGTLPPVHRDPFDRMLVAQAQAEGMVIVTADGQIPSYGVRTMNARL